jgi:23S rRNA (adenine2503-C2)-methyltransferase
MKKTNLKGLTAAELGEYCVALGEKEYRGRQLFTWLYEKEAASFDEMTTFSKSFREQLSAHATIGSLAIVEAQRSAGDGTTKFLFELSDGRRIESVLIPPKTAFRGANAVEEEEQKRLTLCVSTQVGCPLDCAFCATATMGFTRNLTPGEIVDQVMLARAHAGKPITNLVYMGMGEPLLNYDSVMKSVEIVTTGLKIAAKRITVSTAGWAPEIRRMADEGRKVKLAVSLHSLDDAARTDLMPVNKRFPLVDLLDAVHYYYRKTKERVTFEYILFDGWNDTDDDLRRLVRLTRSVPSKINIIPFHDIAFANPAAGRSDLRPASAQKTEAFVRRLREQHVTVFIRSSAGEDIDAACGQLAIKSERKRKPRPAVRRSLS